MKRLKPGHKITVVLLSKTYRAKSQRGGRGRVYFKLVGDHHIPDRGIADFAAEGISWCRGWDTHAAKALKSATALL